MHPESLHVQLVTRGETRIEKNTARLHDCTDRQSANNNASVIALNRVAAMEIAFD